MPPPCSVCIDPRRAEIDDDLGEGASVRELAGLYGLSKSAIGRHRKHVSLEASGAVSRDSGATALSAHCLGTPAASPPQPREPVATPRAEPSAPEERPPAPVPLWRGLFGAR